MKVYKLKNLDCADCAVKIEEHLKRTKGVKHVSVNFATAKISIDTDAAVADLRQEIKRIEPDVEIEEVDNPKDSAEESFKIKRETHV